MRPVRGLARALLGGLFIAAGGQTVLNPDRYLPRAEPITDRVSPMLQKVDARLPAEARQLIQVTGAVQMAAGFLLATGIAPRPAAAVLAGTLVPATVVGHPFWEASTPAARRAERVQFAKNLGLMGGLLLAAADTAGSPSLRWRTSHAIHDAQKSLTRAKKKAQKHMSDFAD